MFNRYRLQFLGMQCCLSLLLALALAGCSSSDNTPDVPLTLDGKLKAIEGDSSLTAEEKAAKKSLAAETAKGLERMKRENPTVK